MKTKQNRINNIGNKTRKQTNKTNKTNMSFQREITVMFLEMLMMVKLFHWKTTNYATHQATDELYTKLNKNVDEFIEILLGKNNSRINLMKHKKIRLLDLSDKQMLEKEIKHFKHYLIDLNNHKYIIRMSNTDLLNIRDTILGDLNQFLYLLSLQ
jgi:DNA-binding ferritin-like protein